MKGDKSDTGWNNNPSDRHDYSPPPASAAAYIPPTQVPKETKYHTLDLKAVRLSADIDPKRMKTQMSLRRLPTASASASRASVWVSLCLAGAALGLGAWWCLQWWREQGDSVLTRSTQEPVGLAVPAVAPATQGSVAVGAARTLPVVVPSGSRLVLPPKLPKSERPNQPPPPAGR